MWCGAVPGTKLGAPARHADQGEMKMYFFLFWGGAKYSGVSGWLFDDASEAGVC